MHNISSVETDKLNLKKTIVEPIVKLVSDIFSPPQQRLIGNCITHGNTGNVQIHTPIDIITDQTGEKYCNCPKSRKCIQEARVITGAKPRLY